MNGLYLYCIRKRSDASRFVRKGIDPVSSGKVFAYPFLELEAVVSEISMEEFDPEEVQNKAQTDLTWIKEKAIIHEMVIEEAMKKDKDILSVIPMKFGTIFKDGEKLKEALCNHYEQFKVLLAKLEKKQEWSVKIYLKDKKKLEQAVKEKNEMIKEKEKEITALPEGIAYFMEEELNEIISKELDKELNNIVKGLFEDLGEQAAALVENKILEKELTGRREPMVLNSAFLIPENKIKSFKARIENLNQEIQEMGLSLEYSGPWPAYNFIPLNKNTEVQG